MEPEKKSNGALIGSIVIVIIIVIGGIYIWQSKIKSALEEKKIQSENVIPADITELDTLETDLDTLDIDIDIDIDSIN